MFDLEQKISEWRKQMLAAGIKTPVPLEELEIHLREEIERQMKSGQNEQRAFEIAVRQIGQAAPLKMEFKKAGGFLDWLGEDKIARTNRTLALLWLAYCSWIFFVLTFQLAVIPSLENFRPTPDLFLSLLVLIVFLRGMVASIRLFGGNNKEIRTIHLIAILGIIAFVAQIIAFRHISTLAMALTFFNIATLWLLRPAKIKKLNPAAE